MTTMAPEAFDTKPVGRHGSVTLREGMGLEADNAPEERIITEQQRVAKMELRSQAGELVRDLNERGEVTSEDAIDAVHAMTGMRDVFAKLMRSTRPLSDEAAANESFKALAKKIQKIQAGEELVEPGNENSGIVEDRLSAEDWELYQKQVAEGLKEQLESSAEEAA